MIRSFSHQDQNQGGQKGTDGPQGDPAEEEEDPKTNQPEEEGLKEACAVPEEWSRLPMSSAGQPGKHLPAHGPQGGQAVPPDGHSQMGQVQ